ncbi:MAG: TonB-dependent receptor [Chromatiales bacterium]|nr:TonB-dependent receptor [Chromatiales bacterium]
MADTRCIRSVGPRLFLGALVACFATESWAQIEEIIVTVRKREESLQNVPIAVTAIGAQEIQRLNISDIADLSKYNASVIFDQGFSSQDTRITIRGLAPVRGRQNVAVLVDGIDIANQANLTNGSGLLINPRLFDLERIEVVKGPQNALYGRTAFAGAINYITRKPGDELEGTAGMDIGNNGRLEFRGGLSGPLVPGVLAGGINVASWNHDGFYRNSVTGAKVGNEQGVGFSGTLVYTPTERFSATYRLELISDEFGQSPYSSLEPTTPVPIPQSAINAQVISPNLPSVLAVRNIPRGRNLAVTLSENPRTGVDYPGVDREIWRNSLTLDFDAGPVLVRSLTHFAQSSVFSFEDARREGSVSVNTTGAEFWLEDETQLFSQELRLQSTDEGPINWTVGALYWREKNDSLDGGFNCIQVPAFIPGIGPVPGVPCGPSMVALVPNDAARLADSWDRDTRHWSVYGLVEIAFLENFRLALEGRYVDERLVLSGPDRPTNAFFRAFDTRNPSFPPPGAFPGDLKPAQGVLSATEKDSYFLPKATLQWLATDDAMLYFSWARAAKPAGLSNVAALQGFDPTNRFDTEKLTVYEMGAKTTWLDGRLLANAAVFFQDYTDKQTTSQFVTDEGILLTRSVNAASAEVLGVEFDLVWQVIDSLRLRTSYTWLDTEYKRYDQLNAGAGRIADAGSCIPVQLQLAPGSTANPNTCLLDLSGRSLEFAPEHSVVAGFDFEMGLVGNTSWFLEGDYIFQDSRFINDSNTIELNSWWEAAFRVGIRNDQWEILAYIDNAFNDDTVRTTFGNTFNQGITVAPFPPGAGLPATFVLPLNQTPILPDQRQFGLRVNYRFGSAF